MAIHGSMIFGMQYALVAAFGVENNRKKFGACNFLSIWLVKLEYCCYY